MKGKALVNLFKDMLKVKLDEETKDEKAVLDELIEVIIFEEENKKQEEIYVY